MKSDLKLESEFHSKAEILLWLLLLLCFVAAVSNQSLWIDELLTAVKAREPTLRTWWQRMVAEKASDLQMPLYMFWMWAQAKVFGSSEWALRAGNLPWMVAGAVAFVRSFTMGRQRMAASLVVMMSPFGWYYLNEARPYAMQLGSSLLILGALRTLNHLSGLETTAKRRWFLMFCLGLIVLSGTSMLGMVWAGGALGALAVFSTPTGFFRLLRRYWMVGLATAGMLLALGFYYLWTLTVGARASAVAGTGWQNVAFIFYELTGFSGLGPGRIQLRELGMAALRPYFGWIALHGVVLFLVLGSGLKSMIRSPDKRRVLAASACLIIPLSFLIGSAIATHFRLLGRHFTPLLPVVIMLFVLGVSHLWQPLQHWKKGLVVIFIALNLVSSLSLRFAARHARDDYRGAAAAARTALQQGKTVWWNAAAEGVEYYNLPITAARLKQGDLLVLTNPSREELAGLPRPNVLIVSKADIYDAAHSIMQYLTEQNFVKVKTLPAFTIWELSDVAP